MITQRQANGGSENTTIIRPRKAEQRGIAPVSIVSAEYWERFCFAHNQHIRTLPDVEKILNSITQNEMEHSLAGLYLLGLSTPQPLSLGNSSTKTPLALSSNGVVTDRLPSPEPSSSRVITAQFQNTHSLTSIQLLDTLCSRISQESYALAFDYFSFHTRCTLLLKSIYDEFEKEIVELDGELDWGSAEMPVVPHWLFKLMEDDGKRDDVVGRLAKCTKRTVEREGTKEVFAVREVLSGGGKGIDRVC